MGSVAAENYIGKDAYMEFVKCIPFSENEYIIRERDPIKGTRSILVNKDTRRIKFLAEDRK